MRSNYYVFLAVSSIWMLALGLLAGPIASAIGIFHPLLFVVSPLAIGLLLGQFTCSYCQHPIVRPIMTVGVTEMKGFTMFPGPVCTNCGQKHD